MATPDFPLRTSLEKIQGGNNPIPLEVRKDVEAIIQTLSQFEKRLGTKISPTDVISSIVDEAEGDPEKAKKIIGDFKGSLVGVEEILDHNPDPKKVLEHLKSKIKSRIQ